MNSLWYKQKAQSHQQEIAKLQQQKAQEVARVHDFQKRSNDAANKAPVPRRCRLQVHIFANLNAIRNRPLMLKKRSHLLSRNLRKSISGLTEAEKNSGREEKREIENQRREDERRANDEKRKAEARRRDEQRREREHQHRMHEVLHRKTWYAIEKLSQLPEEITVLFMAANPLDQPQLRLDEEVRAINEMITKSRHRDSVRLESRWAVRPLDVLQSLNELRPRIVHFSGHGSDQDEIVFQDSNGQTKLVTKEAIAQTMAAASGEIRLVFFNTCYSHNQAEAIVKHVPAAIGMTTSIGDAAARIFAGQFYSAVGFGLQSNKLFIKLEPH